MKIEILHSPHAELEVLAYLCSSGKKAFAAEFNDRRLTPLVTKGFVIRLGGTDSVLEWPFVVQNDVWEFMLANPEYFYRKDLVDRPDPFHWRGAH